MTVQPAAGTNLPTPWSDLETGLEDFGYADSVVPRITIRHKQGVFKDNLTSKEFPTIRVIILGLVKQRVMWDSVVEDNDKPMCKSTDFEGGYPNYSEDTPKRKQFPWDKSNFDPPADLTQQVVLPCASCRFKEWDTDPSGRKPWCNEQYTFPLLYDPEGDGNFIPAIFTTAKSGLKTARQYITGFSRSHQPMYTVYTQLSLRSESRGDNNFAVPLFAQLGPVDQAEWPGYSVAYKEMKNFLRRPPTAGEDAESEGYVSVEAADNRNTPAPSAGVTAEDKSEVQAESSPAAPVAPASPAATPAAQAPVPAAAPAAPVPQATAPVSEPAGDDDLPF